MMDYIKTGFPILDDVLGGGFRIGLTIIRCEDAQCAWVAKMIVDGLSRNAETDNDVKTYSHNPDQARVDARMNDRVAVMIRGGSAQSADTHCADLILEIKPADGGYEVRVAKRRHGRIGGGVAMASTEGVLVELCALASPSPENASLPPGGTTMKEALGLIVECAKDSEFLRWETAMRDVADDLTRRDQACQRLIAANGVGEDRLAGKASAYAHAAEMLRAAIASMKEGT